jgi:hypothetical protein
MELHLFPVTRNLRRTKAAPVPRLIAAYIPPGGGGGTPRWASIKGNLPVNHNLPGPVTRNHNLKRGPRKGRHCHRDCHREAPGGGSCSVAVGRVERVCDILAIMNAAGPAAPAGRAL